MTRRAFTYQASRERQLAGRGQEKAHHTRDWNFLRGLLYFDNIYDKFHNQPFLPQKFVMNK